MAREDHEDLKSKDAYVPAMARGVVSREDLVKTAMAHKATDRLMLECLGRIEVILEDIVQRLASRGEAVTLTYMEGDEVKTQVVDNKRAGKRKF